MRAPKPKKPSAKLKLPGAKKPGVAGGSSSLKGSTNMHAILKKLLG